MSRGVAAVAPPSARARPRPALRALRGVSGALAWGLAALAVALVLVQWLGPAPGPGAGVLVGHGGAAVVTLVLQRAADRSRGGIALAASLAVLVVVAAVLWTGWWR